MILRITARAGQLKITFTLMGKLTPVVKYNQNHTNKNEVLASINEKENWIASWKEITSISAKAEQFIHSKYGFKIASNILNGKRLELSNSKCRMFNIVSKCEPGADESHELIMKSETVTPSQLWKSKEEVEQSAKEFGAKMAAATMTFDNYKKYHKENHYHSAISNQDKITLVAGLPEINRAVQLLTTLFVDVDAKNFVSMGFDFMNEKFELVFQRKIVTPPFYSEIKGKEEILNGLENLKRYFTGRNDPFSIETIDGAINLINQQTYYEG